MRTTSLILVLVIAAVLTLWWESGGRNYFNPSPSSSSYEWSELEYFSPSDSLRPSLLRLRPYSLSESETETVVRFYLDFAKVIASDRHEILKTNIQFRDALRHASELLFSEAGIDRRNAGLTEDVDAILALALDCDKSESGEGWNVVEISAEKRSKLSEALTGIAWAFAGGE